MDSNITSSEYINIDDALSRVGGNMALYKRLLSRFVEGDQYGALISALESGDNDEAVRQAHSLKGVSANLSLSKIWAITVDLEQMLKNNSDYSSTLDELTQAFTTTTEMITKLLSDDS